MTYDDLMNGSIYLVLVVERDHRCAVAAALPAQGLLGSNSNLTSSYNDFILQDN
jgi:hypothetical protein